MIKSLAITKSSDETYQIYYNYDQCYEIAQHRAIITRFLDELIDSIMINSNKISAFEPEIKQTLCTTRFDCGPKI